MKHVFLVTVAVLLSAVSVHPERSGEPSNLPSVSDSIIVDGMV